MEEARNEDEFVPGGRPNLHPESRETGAGAAQNIKLKAQQDNNNNNDNDGDDSKK